MPFSDFILERAAKQLEKNSKAVTDGAWFDSLIEELYSHVEVATWETPVKTSSIQAIRVIEANKNRIVGMGADAFVLFIQQLAIGKQQAAADTYLRAVGTADDIIDAMDKGTLALIDAKRKLDEFYADAWTLIKDIAITTARQLLPLLLALI